LPTIACLASSWPRELPGGSNRDPDIHPSRIAERREQVAQVEVYTSPSQLQVIKEHADGAGWPELGAARGLNPEALWKRIERVRRRIMQALAEPETDTIAEDR
jgi:hypothetical protein